MTRIEADWLESAEARAVCDALASAGFGAWFVGGCVRNALFGAPVSDLDIATDARPEQTVSAVEAAGLKAVPTGIDHGTVTVISGGQGFEVTTFRRDVETNGRHAVVAFTTVMEEDARRRDFTMNALYAGADGVVIDPLGQGLDDLAARRIRFIDDPAQRIAEDHLRIMRFFRFTAWFGDPEAGIDPEGLAACAEGVERLATLSAERVTAELLKLLAAPDPAMAVAAFAATGGLAQVLPGANAAPLAVLVHVEQAAGLAPDPIRRLALLGGETEGLRLSRVEARRLEAFATDGDAGALGYRLGGQAATDALAVRAALEGRALSEAEIAAALHGAGQVFPLAAADLMPELQGAELGRALKQAEARWIASGFTLSKDALRP